MCCILYEGHSQLQRQFEAVGSTWQEGCEDEASLCKDNSKEECIGGFAVLGNYDAEVLVQVQYEVHKPCTIEPELGARLPKASSLKSEFSKDAARA